MAESLEEGMEGELKVETDQDLELEAITKVYAALKSLDADARSRVLDYVVSRFGLALSSRKTDWSPTPRTGPEQDGGTSQASESPHSESPQIVTDDEDDGLEGVSPIAKKWIKRNDLSDAELSSLFTLGVDDIDLVARSVPGKSFKEKLRSVALLLGVAEFLGSGTAKISSEKMKEAAGHYGAVDTNFSKNLKTLASEVTGSAAAGYVLTGRGLNAAAELIKQIGTKGNKA